MKKYKNRKDAVKTVVAILCAALMLTACVFLDAVETVQGREGLRWVKYQENMQILL